MGDQPQVEMAFPKQQHTMATMASPSLQESKHELAPTSSPCNGAKLRKAELSLRFIALIASIAAFIFLITDKQTRSFTIFTSVVVQKAIYSDMKAIVYSVIILGTVALYSAAQITRCLLRRSSTSISPSSALAWTIFLLDQVMTYLILSSAAATAQSAWFSEQGNDKFGWAKVCYLYEKFCKQVGTGIIGAFVVFTAMLFTSLISAFNLFAPVDVEDQ